MNLLHAVSARVSRLTWSNGWLTEFQIHFFRRARQHQDFVGALSIYFSWLQFIYGTCYDLGGVCLAHVIWSQSILHTVSLLLSLQLENNFIRMFFHLHLIFKRRVPKCPCSLIVLTVSIFLSAIFLLICYNLLFRGSSLHLCISEIFNNRCVN